MADQKSAEPKTRELPIEDTVGKTTATVTLTLKSTAVVVDVQTKIVTRPAATRRPLEADLVNPLPENFHRKALSVPLAHAAVLMAEYRSANINGALISP
jgi:hypothetical protein